MAATALAALITGFVYDRSGPWILLGLPVLVAAVFRLSDLHHMGIFVGNNTVVHAPHTGDFRPHGRHRRDQTYRRLASPA
jgi:hypothetical protein